MISKIFGSPTRIAAFSVLLVALFCIAALSFGGCAGVTVPGLSDILITPTPYVGPAEPTQPPRPTVKPTMPPVHPLPSMTPEVKPTQEPTKPQTMKVCVSKIPKMTEENKDQINKQLLFCAYTGDQAVGIYHRYLQPKWPYGDWWPTWRIEVWSAGKQVGEWDVKKSGDLPADSAIFLIDYSGAIEVTCLTTGDTQTLDWKFPAGKVPLLGEDEECESIGWHSKAESRLCK